MLLVVISVVIGAATHILWDSLTHRSFWPYQHWHFLSHAVQLPVIGPVQYYKTFQYLSTVAGLIALLIWFWHWYRHTAPIRSQKTEHANGDESKILIALCVATAVAALLRGFLGDGIPSTQHQVEILLADIASTAITVFWIGVVAYGVLRAQRRSRPEIV